MFTTRSLFRLRNCFRRLWLTWKVFMSSIAWPTCKNHVLPVVWEHQSLRRTEVSRGNTAIYCHGTLLPVVTCTVSVTWLSVTQRRWWTVTSVGDTRSLLVTHLVSPCHWDDSLVVWVSQVNIKYFSLADVFLSSASSHGPLTSRTLLEAEDKEVWKRGERKQNKRTKGKIKSSYNIITIL